MELTHDDVVSILELLERSNVEYLEVEVGSSRIVADRTGVTTQARGGSPVAAAGAGRAPAPAPAPVAAPAPVVAPPVGSAGRAPPVAPPAAAAPVAADLVTVAAPMLGVFFRAPQPGAPNFVEVGTARSRRAPRSAWSRS